MSRSCRSTRQSGQIALRLANGQSPREHTHHSRVLGSRQNRSRAFQDSIEILRDRTRTPFRYKNGVISARINSFLSRTGEINGCKGRAGGPSPARGGCIGLKTREGTEPFPPDRAGWPTGLRLRQPLFLRPAVSRWAGWAGRLPSRRKRRAARVGTPVFAGLPHAAANP